jgi:hypothetical protein
MRNPHHYFSGKILSNVAPGMARGIVHVYKRWGPADYPLGIRVSWIIMVQSWPENRLN